MTGRAFTRRRFVAACAGLPAFARLNAWADDGRPDVANPRATDGDDRFEPRWDERLTLTVGTSGEKAADLSGRDGSVIQAALSQVSRLGGGTVRLLPGTWTLRHPVVFPSKVRLVGSGVDSIITKIGSHSSTLGDDSDWYDREITLKDASAFRVGDGVALLAVNADNGAPLVIKRTLVGRSGNRFRLDSGLRENLWLTGKPTCKALFPLLTAERTTDVIVENLTLDGNKSENENFNGNYGGGIFLQDCARFTLRGITSRNYNGDGISFQITHDVVVERCQCLDNADLGLHPGSGSQRPLIRENKLAGNTIGLFWCWGVKYGLAEKNRIENNRSYGISIGHNDTDNVMRDNDISASGKVGILFRDESRGKDFWPNRNTVENNRVVNSGGESDGVGIDVQGRTHDLKISGNHLEESRAPGRRIGIRIGKETRSIHASNNQFRGFASDIVGSSA